MKTVIRELPPWLMKGSGMPVTGKRRMLTPMLMKAWKRMKITTPTATRRPKPSLRDRGGAQSAQEQEDEEREQQHRADEAKLLAEHAEDVVGGLGAQVVELGLGAVRQAFAEQPARADADLRLKDVEAGAKRVSGWVQEEADALALVGRNDGDEREGQHRDRPCPGSRGCGACRSRP